MNPIVSAVRACLLGRRIPSNAIHYSAVTRAAAVVAEGLEARTLFSTVTVTNLNDAGAGSLRDAVAASAAGDTINFADGLTGTITLTTGQIAIAHDLTIAGPGQDKITVSGDDASRVFYVPVSASADVTDLAISDLTLTHGRADTADPDISGGQVAGGAMAELSGGKFSLTNVTVSHSQAIAGAGLSAGGGGLYVNTALKGPDVTLTNCTFSDNAAFGGSGGGNAFGGAVLAGQLTPKGEQGSLLTLTGGTFANNSAVGGDGGTDRVEPITGTGYILGSSAFGGAVATLFGGNAYSNVTFTGNVARGGSGGMMSETTTPAIHAVGSGFGGGVFFVGSDLFVAIGCQLQSNSAIGGSHAAGFSNNTAANAFVGSGSGGGMTFGINATAIVRNSTLDSNLAKGGDDNRADGTFFAPTVGGGRGGGLYSVGFGNFINVLLSTLTNNAAVGGAGGSVTSHTPAIVGGLDGGAGGAIAEDTVGKIGVQNSVVQGNRAQGARAAAGKTRGRHWGAAFASGSAQWRS